MPDRRPCRCDLPGCNPCALFRDNPVMRRLWSAPAEAPPPAARVVSPPPPPPPAPAIIPEVAARPPCAHEGAVLDRCFRGDAHHARGCGRHGRCSRVPSVLAGRACSACPDYTPAGGG